MEFPVGYASGVFDMFHVGHLNLLRHARTHCGVLIVGVASDEYAERIKGRMPIVPCDERIEIVAALELVDEVVIDRSEDKTPVWHQCRFDAIFKGDDWMGTPKGYRLERAMALVGAEVIYFPYTHNTSSTLLRSFLD